MLKLPKKNSKWLLKQLQNKFVIKIINCDLFESERGERERERQIEVERIE